MRKGCMWKNDHTVKKFLPCCLKCSHFAVVQRRMYTDLRFVLILRVIHKFAYSTNSFKYCKGAKRYKNKNKNKKQKQKKKTKQNKTKQNKTKKKQKTKQNKKIYTKTKTNTNKNQKRNTFQKVSLLSFYSPLQ